MKRTRADTDKGTEKLQETIEWHKRRYEELGLRFAKNINAVNDLSMVVVLNRKKLPAADFKKAVEALKVLQREIDGPPPDFCIREEDAPGWYGIKRNRTLRFGAAEPDERPQARKRQQQIIRKAKPDR